MDWDKLKIFHAVAEAGSFTSATVNLNLSQSAISRQIQSLEDDLKVNSKHFIEPLGGAHRSPPFFALAFVP